MSFKINMPKIDLNPQDWNEVCHILRNHVPEYTVWAFGSRVKWTAKAYSDLDLAIITQKPLSLTSMANIKEAFDESNLSIRVDIVDWATTSEVFRKIIEQDKVVIQVRREVDSDNTSEWKSYRLSEAGKIVTGKTPLTNNPENQGNEFPFITPADFVGNKWITKTIRTISKIGAASVKNCLVPKETVLVTCIGSDMGKAALSAMQCVTNQQINSIIVDTHKFLPEFIYYNLSIRQQEIKSMAGGSAVPILKKSAFSDIWLECPNLKTQKEIVATLAIFDDRIALLRETNITLEAIAQALFKSWFVDFDPVNAKQQGREPEGMDSETAALFPDSFEESELGLVPKGWDISALYDMAQYINGAAYKAFEPNLERRGLPIIKIAELKAGVTAQTAFSSINMPEKYQIGARDILFSWSGNPDTSIDTFVWPHSVAWLNQHIFRVVPNSTKERSLVLLMLKHMKPIFAEIARNKQTTGLGHVTVADLKRLRVVKPNTLVLQRWNEIVEPLMERAFIIGQQAQTLANLRDNLLPRLISGQLRLPEDTTLLEETTA